MVLKQKKGEMERRKMSTMGQAGDKCEVMGWISREIGCKKRNWMTET